MPAVRNLKPANSRRQPPQLIKKPRGQSHRLMDVLGLSKHEWKVLARRIQEVAKRHLNLNVTYPHQDPEARDKFWQEAMEQESIFSKFENGWPLKYYVSDRWLAQKVSRAKNAPGRSSRGSRTTRAEVNVRDDDVQDTEQEELEYLDEGNPEDDAERERTASPTSATQDVEFQETSTLNSGGPSTGIRPFLPRKAKMQSLHRGTERDRDVFPDPPQSSARRQSSPLPPPQSRIFPARDQASYPSVQSVSTPGPTGSTSCSAKANATTSSPLNQFLSSFIEPSSSLAKTFEMYGIKSFEDWDHFIHKSKAERDEILMKFVFVGLISLFQYQTLMVELEKLSETSWVSE